jgi:hypothetical protein
MSSEQAPAAHPHKERSSSVGQPGDVSPSFKGAATTLGLGGKAIEGKPGYLRDINGKEINTWETVMANMSADKLEGVLQAAKADTTHLMIAFIKDIEYQGFNREFYIKNALTMMTVSEFSRFALLGAIRGSKFEKIAENCESMPRDLISAYSRCKFISGKPKKRADLTLLRNAASIPHWCAYWMLQSATGAKIQGSDCPSCLQFPGAASLPMSRDVRIKHLNFCVQFSSLLPGGKFSMSIYMTAYNNPIPVDRIPQDLQTVLGVSKDSQAHKLAPDEVAQFNSSLVLKK